MITTSADTVLSIESLNNPEVRDRPRRVAMAIAKDKGAGGVNSDCQGYCAVFNEFAARHPGFALEASTAAARVLHNVKDLNEPEQRSLVKAVVNAMSYAMPPKDAEDILPEARADAEQRAIECAKVFNFVHDNHPELQPMISSALRELCVEIKNENPRETMGLIRSLGSKGVSLKHPAF